ncbi:MAG: VCBS repeat-containing protein [Bacteriovoracaceae bacterium]|nr:VCBS repeat-containing protein [Bacteriovoracaceae bacterium]
MKTYWFIIHLLFLVQAIADESYYGYNMVQDPKIAKPQKGSMSGFFSDKNVSENLLATGDYSLKLPIDLPSKRGEILFSIIPSYSIKAGASAWGMRWSNTHSIYRYRNYGLINFVDDNFMTPWGEIEKGNDGFWYTKDMSNVVRVQFMDNKTIHAYLKNGVTVVFGKKYHLYRENESSIYKWYILKAYDKRGLETKFEYIKLGEKSPFYMDKVYWGGRADNYQYVAKFSYKKMPRGPSFIDYRSGNEIYVDRYLKSLEILSKNTNTAQFGQIYKYQFTQKYGYFSSANYLTSVSKTYPSGVSDPTIIFNYDFQKQMHTKERWRYSDKMDDVLADKGMGFLSTSRSTFFDYNDDGLTDIEFAKTHELYVQTKDGFELKKLPPFTDGMHNNCRLSMPFSTKRPRMIIAMKGPRSEKIVVAQGIGAQELTLCSRVGNIVGIVKLPPGWDIRKNIRIVDIDKDGKPDILFVGYNNYGFILNESTKDEYKFSKEYGGRINSRTRVSTVWIHDLNGDGYLDMIGKTARALLVWYGKGMYQFDRDPKTLRFSGSRGDTVDLTNFQILFFDYNNDGMADAILKNERVLYLFANIGNYFRQTVYEGIRGFGAYGVYPVVADLSGDGDLEIAVVSRKKLFTLRLNTPSTGFLIRADDGRGNILKFNYKKSAPQVGIGIRNTLLDSIEVESSGYGIVKKIFQYENPILHSRLFRIQGFSKVIVDTPNSKKTLKYFSNDYYQGIPQSSFIKDKKLASLFKFTQQEYEDINFHGLKRKRLRSLDSGFSTDSGNLENSIASKTIYSLFDVDGICPTQKIKVNRHGTLTTNNKYITTDDHPSCLLSEAVITGTNHQDNSFDFIHRTKVLRNEIGLVSKIFIGGGDTNMYERLIQDVVYTPNNYLLESIHDTKKGKTTFSYDSNYRLQNVVEPSGVVNTIDKISKLSDNILSLTIDRGDRDHSLTQYFRYDSWKRLHKDWNNLNIAGSTNPLSEYKYHFATANSPGVIEINKRVNDTATSSIKEYVLTASNGKSIGSIKGPSLQSKKSVLFRPKKYNSSNNDVSTFSSKLVEKEITPDKLIYPQIYNDNSDVEIGYNLSAIFDLSLKSETVYQQGVKGQKNSNLEISSFGIQYTTSENGTYETLVHYDDEFRKVEYLDEDHNHYRYSYDVMGRVRKIKMPGTKLNTQKISINNLGEIERINRSDLMAINYLYDNKTGHLARKVITSPDKKVIRSVDYLRDNIGRALVVTNTNELTNEKAHFEYSHDGKQFEADEINGQLGFTTSIRSKDFTKTYIYRVDGKLLQFKLVINGWNTYEVEFDYYPTGIQKSKHVLLKDTSGNLISELLFENKIDELGNTEILIVNSAPLLNYQYDEYFRPSVITMSLSDGRRARTIQNSYDTHTGRQNAHAIINDQKQLSSMELSWNFNNRGFITDEKYDFDEHIGTQSFDYTYTNRGFLQSRDSGDDKLHYMYDPFGLMKEYSVNNKFTLLEFNQNNNQWKIGNIVYHLDEIGQVIKKDGKKFIYGPQGRISKVIDQSSNKELSQIIYDEKSLPIIKNVNGKIVEAYLYSDETLGVLITDTTAYHPVDVGTKVVGIFANDEFIPITADMKNSFVISDSEILDIPSPYGVRKKHSGELSKVIDFIGKGYDKDVDAVRMGHRYYDPVAKRFLTPDLFFMENSDKCVASPVECNLYSYAGNNPVSFVDPSGEALATTIVLGIIGLGSMIYDEYKVAKQASLPPMQADAMGIQSSYALENAILLAFSTFSLGNRATSFVRMTSASKDRSNYFRSALQHYKNTPLTNAGRALTKHPEVAGLTKSTLRNTLRTSSQINDVASSTVKNMMRNGIKTTPNLGRYGKVIQYRLNNGYGARWRSGSDFIGFITP